MSEVAGQLRSVSDALAALAAELRDNGEQVFVDLVEDMQQQAAAPVRDESEARERLGRLTRRYDAMRAQAYGIDSVFFGYPTPAETKAATARLEDLRDAVTDALHASAARSAFLAEVQRRGYPRERLLLLPGPDEDRDPDGGVVIESPSPRNGGAWRVYRGDRGIADEARFDSEGAAYAYVLESLLPPR